MGVDVVEGVLLGVVGLEEVVLLWLWPSRLQWLHVVELVLVVVLLLLVVLLVV